MTASGAPHYQKNLGVLESISPVGATISIIFLGDPLPDYIAMTVHQTMSVGLI